MAQLFSFGLTQLMVVLGTILQLWLMHALPGCAMAAPIRFLGRKRVGWANWELLAVIIPFSAWTLLMLSPLSVGRKTTNLIEPLYIGCAMPLVALVHVAVGGRYSKRVQVTTVLTMLCGVGITAFFMVPLLKPDLRRGLTSFDQRIVDAHEQRYMMSCIPSAVEMVLKLVGRVPHSYYGLQTAWKNKADGSFQNFDGKTFEGVTFHHRFYAEPHGPQFPLSSLFEAIDHELKAGRYVTVGLARGGDVHSWLIYDEAPDGEFLAVSKFGPWTIEQRHVKRAITRMQGTDIGTYEVNPRPLERYPVQTVGASAHTEWWIPAEDLAALNENIVGLIEVIAEFRKESEPGGAANRSQPVGSHTNQTSSAAGSGG